MKRMMLLLLLCLPVLLPVCGWSQGVVTLPVDTKESVLHWTGHSEVGTYAPVGTLMVHEGVVTLKKGQFAGAKLAIDMRSLKQDNEQLTHHLQSADFFDVEKYPVSMIQIDKVDHGMVAGTITMKDKTEPFEAPVKVAATDKGFVVTGNITLDRTKYGITYNSTNFFTGLGNKAIRNTFEVEFKIVVDGKLPAAYLN